MVEAEFDEFKKACLIFKPLSASMAARFAASSSSTTEPKVDKKSTSIDNKSIVPDGDNRASPSAQGIASFKSINRTSMNSVPWIPSSILCKRLGIKVNFSTFDTSATAVFVKDLLDKATIDSLVSQHAIDNNSNQNLLSDQVDSFLEGLKNRPQKDFFRQIFNDGKKSEPHKDGEDNDMNMCEPTGGNVGFNNQKDKESGVINGGGSGVFGTSDSNCIKFVSKSERVYRAKGAEQESTSSTRPKAPSTSSKLSFSLTDEDDSKDE